MIPSIDYSFCAPSVWIVISGGRDRDMGAGCGGVATCVGAFDCDGVDAMVVVFFLPGTGFPWNHIVVVVVRVGALWAGFRGAKVDVMRIEDDPIGSIVSLVAGDAECADGGTAAARCCFVLDVNFDEPVIRWPDVIWIGVEVIDVGTNDAWRWAGV